MDQVGSPSDIYRHPQSRFVTDFIGRANFINGSVKSKQNGMLQLEILGHFITVPATADQYNPGSAVTVVVRPEMMALNPTEAHVEGVVRMASYLGNVAEYEVDVAGQILTLVDSDPRHLTIHPIGETVQIGFLEDCLYVLPAES